VGRNKLLDKPVKYHRETIASGPDGSTLIKMKGQTQGKRTWHAKGLKS
jgi:hypothetical protein